MKNYTLVNILLDRSGSMSVIRDDMIGGLNSLIEEQKKVPGVARYTLLQFDTPNAAPVGMVPRGLYANAATEEFPQTVYEDVPEDKVPPLTKETFVPRGGTALYDAACLSVDKLGQKLARMKEEDRPSKVLFIIITDGMDNQSRMFTKEDLKKRVERQEKVYNWSFEYLGANQDAVTVGEGIGLRAASCVSYDASARGVSSAYQYTSGKIRLAKMATTHPSRESNATN